MKVEALISLSNRDGEQIGNLSNFVGRILAQTFQKGVTLMPTFTFSKGREEPSIYAFAFSDSPDLDEFRRSLKSFMKLTNQEACVLVLDGRVETVKV